MNRLKVLLHNVRSMHNVGAAFRSADAFGISELLLGGYTPVPPRPEISKAAIGAEDHVYWSRVENVSETVARLREDGYLFICFEQTSESIPFPELHPTDRPLCLVFGNEVTGVDAELLPLMDRFVEIPQYGHKHSLNVSVTVGVALYGMLEKYW